MHIDETQVDFAGRILAEPNRSSSAGCSKDAGDNIESNKHELFMFIMIKLMYASSESFVQQSGHAQNVQHIAASKLQE